MGRIVFAAMAVLTMSLVSCTSKAPDPAALPATAGKEAPATAGGPAAAEVKGAVVAAAATQTLEVACAGCVYKMPDAKGCSAAVKIAGKAYHAEIPGFNVMAVGLCAGAKQAEITGELKGDKFIASKIVLK